MPKWYFASAGLLVAGVDIRSVWRSPRAQLLLTRVADNAPPLHTHAQLIPRTVNKREAKERQQ